MQAMAAEQSRRNALLAVCYLRSHPHGITQLIRAMRSRGVLCKVSSNRYDCQDFTF
jgi:hypothetical protein